MKEGPAGQVRGLLGSGRDQSHFSLSLQKPQVPLIPADKGQQPHPIRRFIDFSSFLYLDPEIKYQLLSGILPWE